MKSTKSERKLLLLGLTVTLTWSALDPHDWMTWWLEIAPVFLGLPLLFLTCKRFPLSPLLYRLLFFHAVILIVGGKYNYAEVPIGFWFQDALGLARNHYDRLGHFVQGFVPAILAREVLLRTSPLTRGKWLFTLVVALCLAFSATYEIFEWWSAALGGESAEAFLGTQGDVWDAQWDMLLAFIGAISALLILPRVHDRSLSGVVS